MDLDRKSLRQFTLWQPIVFPSVVYDNNYDINSNENMYKFIQVAWTCVLFTVKPCLQNT